MTRSLPLLLRFLLLLLTACSTPPKGPTCGDGTRASQELCDTADLDGATCVSLGYNGGTLACTSDCTFDTTGCHDTPPLCGNGRLDPGESCDGTPLACSVLGFEDGEALCSSSCTLSIIGCTPLGAGVLVPRDTIGAGFSQSCALDAEGAASCWGSNQLGGLGVVPQQELSTLTPLLGEHTFRTISVALNHTCAVDIGGRAYCWGSDQYGQLGLTERPRALNRTEGLHFPSPLNPMVGEVVTIETAYGSKDCSNTTDHTCLLNTEGEVYCFGDNTDMVLGSPLAGQVPWPSRVETPHRFVHLSTAGHHTCALNGEGHAFCWGSWEQGGLGCSSDPQNEATGSATPLPVLLGLRYETLDTGGRSTPVTCGLTTEKEVFCWGSNKDGALGAGSPLSSSATPLHVSLPAPVVAIQTGGTTSCAVAAGDLHCWGRLEGLPGIAITTSSTPLPIQHPNLPELVDLHIGDPESILVLGVDGSL